MPIRHRRTVLLAAGVGAGVAASTLVRARWSRGPDPTDGHPLDLPPGEIVAIPTHDGAVLGATLMGPKGGRLVVAAHGWVEDRRIWAAMARLLVARGYQVLAYDQRGHGLSTFDRAGLTVEAIADDLKAVLEHLDARDAIVIGHSMGGMTAQAFAIRHPDTVAERVSALVLVSTASGELDLGRVRGRLAALVVGSGVATAALRNPITGPWWVRGAHGKRTCLAHLDATAGMFAATPAAVRADFLVSMSSMDLTGGLPHVKVPAVVIVGSRDALTPPNMSRTIAGLIPDSRLIVLPGLGHQLVFEAPGRLAEAVMGCAAGSEDARRLASPTPI